MNSLFSTVKDLASTTNTAVNVARWSGHWVSRQYNSGKYGVCLICNNLQPYDHEDTFGRAGAGWYNNTESFDDASVLRNASTTTTLVLNDISTKKLLETREINKETGLPKRNCRFCRLLCDIFDAFFIDEYMSWITETINAMPISVGLMIREGHPLIINCTCFTYDKHILHPRVDLEVYTESASIHGTDLKRVPCTGPVGVRVENVDSEMCSTFMKDCLEECCTEHASCTRQKTSFVPTRLLYLGSDDKDLRLCDTLTTGTEVKWVALSHCWGGAQPFKLLKENLSELKEKIDPADLPATFQNAIKVTRHLGLSYLWIDSLCIVQDDKSDWEIEAARMAVVYGDAFIVICAASSPDPHTPFLGPRQSEWLPKSFEFVTGQGDKIPLKVRQRYQLAVPPEQGILEPPYTSAWASLKPVGPLYSRAWCFQETFLATRILHFTPGAVIFECKTHRRSEDQLPPYPITKPDTLGKVDDTTKWQMIVKAYTQRQLTFSSDKLPALGGAASVMPQAKSNGYLAGLWRETLLVDLLWQVMPGGTHKALTYPNERHAAPSWSWASMSRGVTWNFLRDFQPLAEVIQAHTSLVGENTYGQVSGGGIHIRGHAIDCYISTSRHRNEQWVHYLNKDGTKSKRAHFRADGQLMPCNAQDSSIVTARRAQDGEWQDEVQANATFLCIGKTPWRNFDHVGLILCTSTKLSSCMERVGNITSLPKDWYENGKVATMTIV